MNNRYFKQLDVLIQLLLLGLTLTYIGAFYYYYGGPLNIDRVDGSATGRLIRRLGSAPIFLTFYQLLQLLCWAFLGGSRQHQRILGALLGLGLSFYLFYLIFEDWPPISRKFSNYFCLISSAAYILFNYRYYRSLPKAPSPSDDSLLDDEL